MPAVDPRHRILVLLDHVGQMACRAGSYGREVSKRELWELTSSGRRSQACYTEILRESIRFRTVLALRDSPLPVEPDPRLIDQVRAKAMRFREYRLLSAKVVECPPISGERVWAVDIDIRQHVARE